MKRLSQLALLVLGTTTATAYGAYESIHKSKIWFCYSPAAVHAECKSSYWTDSRNYRAEHYWQDCWITRGPTLNRALARWYDEKHFSPKWTARFRKTIDKRGAADFAEYCSHNRSQWFREYGKIPWVSNPSDMDCADFVPEQGGGGGNEDPPGSMP